MIVCAPGADALKLSSVVRTGFKQRLGDNVHIDIEVVKDIPAEKSGKFRYVISHVKPQQDAAPHA